MCDDSKVLQEAVIGWRTSIAEMKGWNGNNLKCSASQQSHEYRCYLGLAKS